MAVRFIISETIKKLNFHIYAAFILYVVTSAALYVIEYKMFAGAIETIFMFVSVYPPLFLIGYLIFGKRPLKRDRKELRAKAMGMVGTMALVVCGLVLYNYLSGDDYRYLVNWQILAIVIVIAVIGLLESKKFITAHRILRVDYISMIFASLLLTTVIFLLATGPFSVAGAENVLAGVGRQDAVFEEHYPQGSEALQEAGGPLGAYLFIGADGERFLVDVASGECLVLSA